MDTSKRAAASSSRRSQQPPPDAHPAVRELLQRAALQAHHGARATRRRFSARAREGYRQFLPASSCASLPPRCSPPPPVGITTPSASARQQFSRSRLSARVGAWRAAGAGTVVQRWLREGYRLPWANSCQPLPFDQGTSLAGLTPEQRAWREKEVQRLFDVGALEAATSDQYVTKAFLVEKKGATPDAPKKWRMVVDLRHINRHLTPQTCRYETLKRLHHLARRGDYMFSLDITDGFYAVSVHPADRKYLTVHLDGVGLVQFAALPMGLSASPWVFTKVMRSFVQACRAPLAGGAAPPPGFERLHELFPDVMAKGLRVLPYVDDFLFLCRTREEALRGREYVAALMETLGLQRQPAKGCWEPTQVLQPHLGLGIDTAEGRFFVPPERLAKLESLASALLGRASRDRGLVPKRLLASFCGTAQSLYLALPPARFMLRSLHEALNSAPGWSGSVRLTSAAKTDLRWFMAVPQRWTGRALFRSPETATLHCDAASGAWGGVLNSRLPARGSFRPHQLPEHITSKELRAVLYSVETFLPHLRGRRVRLWEDNQAVVAMLTSWTSRNPLLMGLIRRLWWLLDTHDISLHPVYIRSAANVWADALSRQVDPADWSLSSAAFHLLESRWGPHTVDCFASENTALLPRFFSAWASPTSSGVDAFAQPGWASENNLCVPPTECLDQLAHLLETNGAAATVVVPNWPAQSWYQLFQELSSERLVLPPGSAALGWELVAFRMSRALHVPLTPARGRYRL